LFQFGFDMSHALGHPDAAAWVLGALDPEDARSFEDHLRSCAQCQELVAGFELVAEALARSGPVVGPPADLEAKTVAAVQYAVMAAGRPAPAGRKAHRWWHLH
jgi:anti-sigma factor RsiW